MKKVPFNYEFWKANPQTKLVTRDDQEAVILGENPNKDLQPLIGYVLYNECWSKNGRYTEFKESILDLFMLKEVEEVVMYINVYPTYTSQSFYDSIKIAIDNYGHKAISVAKIVTIDGIIDFTKCETVHTY